MEFRAFVTLVAALPLIGCIIVPLLGSNRIVKSEIGRRSGVRISLCPSISGLLIHVRVRVRVNSGPCNTGGMADVLHIIMYLHLNSIMLQKCNPTKHIL